MVGIYAWLHSFLGIFRIARLIEPWDWSIKGDPRIKQNTFLEPQPGRSIGLLEANRSGHKNFVLKKCAKWCMWLPLIFSLWPDFWLPFCCILGSKQRKREGTDEREWGVYLYMLGFFSSILHLKAVDTYLGFGFVTFNNFYKD